MMLMSVLGSQRKSVVLTLVRQRKQFALYYSGVGIYLFVDRKKCLRLKPIIKGSNTEKRNLHSRPVNTVSFYSAQIMDMSACNTCGKSVKDRKSIKCNLYLTSKM